jgi:hypothetical protein
LSRNPWRSTTSGSKRRMIAHVQPGLKPKHSVRLSDPADRYVLRFNAYNGALAQGLDGKSLMPRRNENGLGVCSQHIPNDRAAALIAQPPSKPPSDVHHGGTVQIASIVTDVCKKAFPPPASMPSWEAIEASGEPSRCHHCPRCPAPPSRSLFLLGLCHGWRTDVLW